MATLYKNTGSSRTDLLALERYQASERLATHLNKRPYEGHISDNLMSWSSSLLVVVQYAIYRCHIGRMSPSSVRICAVDTSKLPRGQFARDIWLMENVTDGNQELENQQRLRQMGYDNGEYLSQGTLHHKDRSCTMSLDSLIQAGLFELYDELSDPSGRDQWTKRVRHLRILWNTSQATPPQEVQKALKIARLGFPNLKASDMTLLLLAFKNRFTKASSTQGNLSSAHCLLKILTQYSRPSIELKQIRRIRP